MPFILKRLSYLFLLIPLIGLVACSDASKTSLNGASSSEFTVTLDVYKSRSCGCCSKWIDHIKQDGFSANLHHPADLNAVKNKYGILPQYQSCHTAVSSTGYVFEGHIPSRFIKQFLASPPEDAIGLSVPGMPLGSPGMEMGDRFSPYHVMLVKKDGTTEVYANVASLEEQHQ